MPPAPSCAVGALGWYVRACSCFALIACRQTPVVVLIDPCLQLTVVISEDKDTLDILLNTVDGAEGCLVARITKSGYATCALRHHLVVPARVA